MCYYKTNQTFESNCKMGVTKVGVTGALPATPFRSFRRPMKPRLPRKITGSARINLNLYWNELEDFYTRYDNRSRTGFINNGPPVPCSADSTSSDLVRATAAGSRLNSNNNNNNNNSSSSSNINNNNNNNNIDSNCERLRLNATEAEGSTVCSDSEDEAMLCMEDCRNFIPLPAPRPSSIATLLRSLDRKRSSGLNFQ